MEGGDRKTCFVVMGFGKKTDYATGRTLDLDKTYKYIIKPAAEAAGYACVRADEIQHAGVIDVPMYDQLLNADLVIADLSTSNVNAFFELGVRYALRPRTTIVIAEDKFKNPFDTDHITLRRFRHDGEALDIDEVENFRPQLSDAITEIVSRAANDSPVYTFLHALTPPAMGAAAQVSRREDDVVAERARQRIEQAGTEEASNALREPMGLLMQQAELLMEQAKKARNVGNFVAARAILEGIRIAQGDDVDDFVLQELALATYMSKEPSETEALLAAKEILEPLAPGNSLDPETLGLWAAVHKRLAESDERTPDQRAKDRDTAINALERGFHLKHDYYNGINLAYLLNARAAMSAGDDAIADRVTAERIRRQVISICLDILERPIPGEDERAKAETEYWVRATLAEAYTGVGDETAAQDEMERAETIPPPEEWMLKSTEGQIKKLKALLEA